jgi:hypothetical protein
MSPNFELLTVPTTLADYKLDGLSAALKSTRRLYSNLVKEETLDSMPQHRLGSRPTGQTEDSTELWFSLPSLRHQQQEQSAYLATSNRLSMHSNNPTSTSSRTHMAIPAISTVPDLNKPLPSVSTEAEKKNRKTTTLRSFLRGHHTSHLDPSHLQPVPYTHHQRHSSADSGLTLDTHGLRLQPFSRSMPNSPAYDQAQSSRPTPPRLQSTASDYTETSHYQAYSVPPDYSRTTVTLDTQVPDNFDVPPTRVRSFPEGTTLSPTARQNASGRPRPHTWLSPTEPFTDPSQFHLFVEATTGLPDDADPWSPNGPNRLQGSIFARRTTNDNLSAQAQYIPAPIPDHAHQTASWQSFEPPLTSSRSVSAPVSSLAYPDIHDQLHMTPHMHAINAELEMLGLDSDDLPDEELPDYAQSQAEMNALKRQEAAARARELESRWRVARRARGRAG